MADTAALVVALSAQLTKFEKDMKGAVDIASKRTKEIESTFANMNKEINSQFRGLAQIGASQFGPLGGFITKLGPLGLTAAAGIGALTLAFGFLSHQVEDYIQQASKLRDTADTTGLSIAQLKKLSVIALEVGVSAETSEQSINKMTVAVDQLREGSGPLWETLKKINPTLLAQVGNAKDAAEAIDLLAQTFVKLGSEFEKNAFLRAVFGRGGFAFGRVLTQIAELQGGLKGIAAPDFDKTVKQIDDLKDQLDAIKKRTSDLWGNAFAVDVLNAQISAARYLESIAKFINDVWTTGKQTAPPTSLLGWIMTGGGRTSPGNLFAPKPASFADRFGATQDRPLTTLQPMPPEKPPSTGLTLEQQITKMKEWIGAMGDAVTQGERLKLQQLELQKAVKDNTISQEDAARVQKVLNAEQQITISTLRERLNVASEEEIVQAKLLQARLDATKAGVANIDLTKAEIIFRKQAKETIEAQAAALSKLPESVRFSQQALDSFKQLDQLLVSTAGNFENTFADIATNSKTASEAFKALADSIIKDLIRIAIRMSVTGPLLKSLGALFTPAGVTTGPSFEQLFGRQSGGPVSGGRPYVVGEHGPELFVPQTSGHIMPNAISGGRASGGTSIEVNNYVATDTETRQQRQEGPNGERVIIDIVKKAQARGDLDDVNRGRFGLRPAKVR